MDTDFVNRLGDLFDAALGMLQGLFWVLILAAGFIMRQREKHKKASSPAAKPASTGGYRERNPIDPANQPGFGSTYAPSQMSPPPTLDDNGRQADRQRKAAGRKSSSFTGQDSFGSMFDQPQEKSKWGFDESEWSSAFGTRKSSEPTIKHG